MWMLGPKGIVGHGNGAWGGTDGRCGPRIRPCSARKMHNKDTAKQEILMGAMLTGGNMGYQ